MSSLPILVVDDEQSMREFLSIMLKRKNLEVDTAESGDDAVKKIERGGKYQLVITDLRMPGTRSGLDVLSYVKSVDPACQVVVMTAYASPETAISAVQQGAYDYITKPFKVGQAGVVVDRALEKYALYAENTALKKGLHDGFGGFIGRSKVMEDVFDVVRRVADTKTTVLVTGESGTGKELVASAIHDHSRLEGKFVAINCGAIPENLIEAELFGYKKGAFTGADKDRAGLFETAEGGTVFLDEVGELPLNTQVRLLRTLQEKKIRRVGDAQEVDVDVRIVAATNRDLKEEVAKGAFREDLYYRLNVIPIELPPLRDRGNDVKLLIEHFVDKFNKGGGRTIDGVDSDAMEVLVSYRYPGNVRELQNVIERAATLTRGSQITLESLPPNLRKSTDSNLFGHIRLSEEGIDLDETIGLLERSLIEQALELTKGNRTEAAKLLGISFRSMRYRLAKIDSADS